MRHVLIASINHVIIRDSNLNVRCYCIERHFKQLFTVIITGELMNSLWHLYRKCFVVSLDIDDFTFIAHAQKRQSEKFITTGKM